MRKYYICFFILTALLAAAILTGSYLYLYRPRPEPPVSNGIMESETVPEDNMVVNQQVKKVSENSGFCLVAENGFLLVFAKDRSTVCLDTHMPLAEFPEQEQQRLMDGIWFDTMIELFNYLESYSS
ncbi:MAG: hypothetical protein RR225_07730 [Clostridium sp.]